MVIEIKNTEEFKNLIYDFGLEKEWVFKGKLPAICEFGAIWCGPCRMVGPILEELSEEYDGKIDIYKVDVDSLSEVSQSFGIRSIPSILFIPMEGEAQMSVGGLSRNTFENRIKNILEIEKDENL